MEPSTLFHGTDHEFDRFSARRKQCQFPGSGLVQLGYSFTPSRTYAAQFGGTILEVETGMTNPFHATRARVDELESMNPRSVRRWKRKLRDAGHDGVIFAIGTEVEEHVPFDPGRIRIISMNAAGDTDLEADRRRRKAY